MRDFFAYRVQDHSNQFSLILNSRRLFQQFLVDAYTMIESERLNFIRFQQHDLRSDTYESIRKLRSNGQQDLSKVGKRIFLPSSFTGGSRYMMQNYLDAMAICKWYGYPDFFITITCNPKWPEVERFLKDTNLNPEDRPGILSRMFKIKLDAICKDLKDRHLFGKAAAVVYTIEFQNRGLPHAHMCLFMENDYKFPTVDHVDQFISAEIPDINEDPELYTLVKDHMIHGPCGNARMSSPCMVDRKCSKGFPKKFQDHSTLDANGFPLYRRRDDGPDRATVAMVPSNNENEQAENDEIKEYYDYRNPSVMRLPFHLPGQQTVYFGPDEDINHVLNKSSVNSSMFLSWTQRNQDPNDTVARTLTYVQFPRFYVWKLDQRIWVPRIKGKTIGRIHSISLSTGEAYYLRILLNKVKGPTSFDYIKTVNGRVYDTFGNACYALGLLNDDSEYIEAIKEANISGSAGYIRNLFATILLSSTLSRPEVVWESTWKYMTDDFLYRFSKYHRVSGLSIPDEQLKNYVLCEIEKYFIFNFRCRLINEELAYDRTDSQNVYQGHVNLLTDEQRSVCEEIMNAVDGDNGGVFSIYGYGGTGKTFLWKTLSAAIRSKGEIVLNVASSGIATLLLDGGRTPLSRFHIPLNLNEDSVCHIKPDDDVAKLLQQTKLIIWDEAPMVHKHAFEALDRIMHDIFNISNSSRSDVLFGGKVIVFGGDFRQILSVVPNGGRQEIVNASLCSSYLWRKCKLLTLTRNMRLTVGRPTFEVEEINNFAKWLLDVGEGNVGRSNDGEAIIEIPPELLIDNSSDPISSLINFVYPSILENYNDRNYFSTRAILAPKNEVVHEINDRLLALFPGEEKEYLSSDSLCPIEDGNADHSCQLDESVMFDVNIKESTNGFCISNGWPTVVSVLGIEDGDFVVFQNMDASSFRITHFKSYLHTVNYSKFHIVMLHPQLSNLWLPLMQHHFNGDNLFDDFLILFGEDNKWNVSISRLWDINHYIVDFSQIAKDLCLVTGDFLVFELIDDRVFRMLLFRPNGLQSLTPDRPLPVVQMVKIEDHGNDVVSFEQEAILEDNVVNGPSDVLVEEAEPPLEQDILDVPSVVDQANDYELTWCLTFRFRFPKPFAMNVDLSVLDEMTVETEDGFSMTLEMQEETARGSIRYALRGWQNFMRQDGLADGGQFDLRYNRNLNRLLISNHNF
ncbi:uncharacterized protein LOC110907105 [Helianthus annuus]|uniref:uncharacterized protein LOC110907105 n=1 Tax=Helianthus annuus TaxID=4232 RepID=UPI00165326AF|nr:uncharacterized protein LOC110907105 [Helianthus annuus]